MFKVIVFLLLIYLGVPALASSPYEPITQHCIIESLVTQYPQLKNVRHMFGIIDSDGNTFEAQIIQIYHDGGTGNIFVGARNGDYQNGYLKVPGLRDQVLNMASCF